MPVPVRARSRTAGFTLTELMVVVTIIMILVALAAPTIGTAFAERRVSDAALDLTRIVRRARTESNAYGKAYLLRISTAIDGPRGAAQLFRGNNGSCNASNWAVITAPGCPEATGVGAGNTYCVDNLNMGRYGGPTFGDHEVRLAMINPVRPAIDICYTPRGTMAWRVGVNPFLETNTLLNGGVLVTFTRYNAGVAEGVVRRVVLPIGSDARIVR